MNKAVFAVALLALLAAASAQGPDAMAGNEAGTADQRQRRRSPSPAPAASPSPAPAGGDNATATAESSPAPATDDATAAAGATAPMAGADTNTTTTTAAAAEPAAAGGAANDTDVPGGTPKPKTNIADKRIKAFYETPEGATKGVAQLRELNKLIAASPAVDKVMKDKNLVATIFAPNNDAVKAALSFLNETQPGVDAKTLQEAGVLEGLLQYHVTAGNAALTADRLKNGMKLTMLNKEPTTIVVGADGSRRLLQDATMAIKSNSGQKFSIADSNYQGGKAIIHIIDGVLIPASMVQQFNLTSLPGATAESMAAAAANETSAANGTEPGEGATKGGAPGMPDTPGAGGAPGAPAPAAKKSSAGIAAATLLAVPTLLAALML